MTIWAIADLHLSFSTPDKSMDVFGPEWKNYAHKIETHWKRCVHPDDLVLIAGDISWASKFEQALVDLDWIDQLPGQKVILKGNHDYWWPTSKRLDEELPKSIAYIHNNAFTWNDTTIGGARLWDTPEFNFDAFIDVKPNPKEKKGEDALPDTEKIFSRELIRLKLSLDKLDPNAARRICLTHYPPLSADLQDSQVSKILEEYRITHCIFGHLHSLKPNVQMFGSKNGIEYLMTAADYIDFKPVKVI